MSFISKKWYSVGQGMKTLSTFEVDPEKGRWLFPCFSRTRNFVLRQKQSYGGIAAAQLDPLLDKVDKIITVIHTIIHKTLHKPLIPASGDQCAPNHPGNHLHSVSDDSHHSVCSGGGLLWWTPLQVQDPLHHSVPVLHSAGSPGAVLLLQEEDRQTGPSSADVEQVNTYFQTTNLNWGKPT